MTTSIPETLRVPGANDWSYAPQTCGQPFHAPGDAVELAKGYEADAPTTDTFEEVT